MLENFRKKGTKIDQADAHLSLEKEIEKKTRLEFMLLFAQIETECFNTNLSPTSDDKCSINILIIYVTVTVWNGKTDRSNPIRECDRTGQTQQSDIVLLCSRGGYIVFMWSTFNDWNINYGISTVAVLTVWIRWLIPFTKSHTLNETNERDV